MKAPEKIYVHVRHKPCEITFSEVKEEGVSNIEYTRTDATWKLADGDNLPEIDKEVIALVEEYGYYKVVFAHRPPEYWDGRNILTNEVTRNYTKRYDKGEWNQPNVKWWLDLELPKMENKL